MLELGEQVLGQRRIEIVWYDEAPTVDSKLAPERRSN